MGNGKEHSKKEPIPEECPENWEKIHNIQTMCNNRENSRRKTIPEDHPRKWQEYITSKEWGITERVQRKRQYQKSIQRIGKK